MPSPRCWSVRNLLDLHMDGRLSASREARVRAHLDACAACRAEARPLLQVRALLRRPRSEASAPPGLAEAILKELEKGRAPASEGWGWRPSPIQAAALACLALLWAGNAGPGPRSQAFEPLASAEARP